VSHTAAQPLHDWAATDPQTDFTVNANGTLDLPQGARVHPPDATFIFMSTNEVYGDRPNFLPLEETPTRLDLPGEHEWCGGVPTSMSIDRYMHSVFGGLEGGGRHDGAGVRPVLRHADRVLPRNVDHWLARAV